MNDDIYMIGTKGKTTLVIYRDDLSGSPREEWDNLGHLILFGRDTDGYGDKHTYRDMRELITALGKTKRVQYPVYAYVHSGVAFSLSDFGDRWDSGICGLIYVTYDEIEKEYGKVDDATIATAKTVLQDEIKALDQYTGGEVYGYTLYEFDEPLDSCGGFYGSDSIEDILDETGFSKSDMKEVYNNYRFNLNNYFEETFVKEVKWSLRP